MPKEYIEREALLNRFKYFHSHNIVGSDLEKAYSVAVQEVMKAPAADVEEVVRCKNCKFAEPITKAEKRIYVESCVMCSRLHPDGCRIAMLADAYCSYGERKDGAVFVDVSPNWVGEELSKEELPETICCPHCKQFPFINTEVQVHHFVRLVCFKSEV